MLCLLLLLLFRLGFGVPADGLLQSGLGGGLLRLRGRIERVSDVPRLAACTAAKPAAPLASTCATAATCTLRA